MSRSQLPSWNVTRDVLLLVSGLAGVFHETVMSNTERPSLLVLFAAMLGLPAFLAKPGNKDNGNGTKQEKDS